MPPPQSVDDAARALGDVYRLAEKRINDELARIITDPNQGNRIRRLKALDAEIARRIPNLENEAKAFINNGLPLAWKSGAVDRATSGFTWTQAHRQALGILANDTFDRALKSTRFMRRDVKALIRAEGASQAQFKVATGQTAKQAGSELARRLAQTGITSVTYADGRHIRASTYTEMLMRTSTALAYNEGGLNQLVQDGIRYVEMIDGADCGLVAHDDTFKVNGKVLPVDVAATYPISHPNAVMSGSVVEPVGRLLAVYRANWSGPVLRVRTARGSRLAIGPNHPVLTRRGWVKADALRVGDHVVSGSVERQLPGSAGDVHLNEMPSRVDDLFAAAWQSGTCTRTVSAPDYFHGDGNYCEGDVDVVALDRELNRVLDLAGGERFPHGAFVSAAGLSVARSGDGASVADLGAVALAATGGVRGGDVGRVGAAVADLDALLAQACADGGAVAPVQLAKLLGVRSGAVALDEIVDVEWDTWHGHAFDLETETGVYWCDGTLVHNCRRDFVARPDIKSDDGAAVATSWRSPEQLADQAQFEKLLQVKVDRRAQKAQRVQRQARQARAARRARVARTA